MPNWAPLAVAVQHRHARPKQNGITATPPLSRHFWYEDADHTVITILLLLLTHLRQIQKMHHVCISILITVFVFCSLCSMKTLQTFILLCIAVLYIIKYITPCTSCVSNPRPSGPERKDLLYRQQQNMTYVAVRHVLSVPISRLSFVYMFPLWNIDRPARKSHWSVLNKLLAGGCRVGATEKSTRASWARQMREGERGGRQTHHLSPAAVGRLQGVTVGSWSVMPNSV